MSYHGGWSQLDRAREWRGISIVDQVIAGACQLDDAYPARFIQPVAASTGTDSLSDEGTLRPVVRYGVTARRAPGLGVRARGRAEPTFQLAAGCSPAVSRP